MIKKKKQNNKKQNIIIGIIAIIAITIITTILLSSKTQPTNEYEDKEIQIPIQELSTTARFYEEELNGVKIKYFVIKDKTGEIKTAFDACDVCYNSKKGYTQEGEYLICNNCGNRYHVSGLGTENKAGGGCWPSYLPSEVKGDKLIIKISDLAKGSYKFVWWNVEEKNEKKQKRKTW